MADHPSTDPYRAVPPVRDPTPWSAGITVAVLVAVLTAVAVYAFGSALAEVHPLLAVLINVVAVGGAAPTAWRWRHTPVTRWVLLGCTSGVALGWIGLVLAGLAAL
ncbi:DUF2537 domain-containing protein [Nocardia higoensis]|uniref:DUF2537 domain-containing protein n=1 Tax=Nocardia higoensis TaxID=228599 RepID=UPI00030BCAAD|nr:DUF2537 domain-containing protein [Nocardia higoensis]